MNWCSKIHGYCVCTAKGDAVTCPLAFSAPPKHANAQQGWECPRCHAINSPNIPRCDCKPGDLNKVT